RDRRLSIASTESRRPPFDPMVVPCGKIQQTPQIETVVCLSRAMCLPHAIDFFELKYSELLQPGTRDQIRSPRRKIRREPLRQWDTKTLFAAIDDLFRQIRAHYVPQHL